MIHENALRSRKLNSVSTGAGELWFRIQLLVDDNGNYFGDPLVIYANAMRSKKGVTVKHVEGFLKELLDAGLLERYTVEEENEPYIHIGKFHEFQSFKSDRPVRVSFPIHPAGPYFEETGKVPLVKRSGVESEQSRNHNGSKLDTDVLPEVEVEVKGEVKGEIEERANGDFESDEPAEDLGNWSEFVKDFHRAAGGVKTFQRFEANAGKYQELCRRHGSDHVHAVIGEWVELKGGKGATKKNQFAAKNFLEEAEALIEDRKSVELEPESDEVARVAGPRGVRPELMR